jgi:hypothetical protein
MDADKLIQGRFLKAADFDGKPWTTPPIASVKLEKLEGNTGPRVRGVLYFESFEKGWVVNRTNLECLKAMFGRETDDWIGKRVTLHPVVWSGEDLAIRVKGSPDIERPVTVEVKLPRKKPFTMQMQKIDGRPKAGAAAKPPTSKPASGDTGEAGREPTDEELAGSAARPLDDVNF